MTLLIHICVFCRPNKWGGKNEGNDAIWEHLEPFYETHEKSTG